MRYRLTIKSHSNAPDFELYHESVDKETAVRYFQDWLGNHSEEYPEWEFIYNNTEEDESNH